MKRIILIFPVLALALAALACQVAIPNMVRGSGDLSTETRDVSGFDAIVLENSGDVFVTIGKTEELTIEADDNLLPYLTSEVKNGVLTLGTTPGRNINPTRPIVYNVTVKELNNITLAGSGSINVEPLEADKMTVLLAGSGNISLQKLDTSDLEATIAGSGNISVDELTAERVDATVSGSGDIRLAGETPTQKLGVCGSGNYLAGDLQSENANINIAGSGNATVWVTEHLTVTVNGSGNIRYYGKPSVDHTDNGSGTLTSLGEK